MKKYFETLEMSGDVLARREPVTLRVSTRDRATPCLSNVTMWLDRACANLTTAREPSQIQLGRTYKVAWRAGLAAYRATPARSPFSFSVPAWHYSAWWRRVTRVSHV